MEIISEPTSSNIELSNVCEVTNEITHESDLNSNKNKEDITISLTNFDPYCKKKYFLNRYFYLSI